MAKRLLPIAMLTTVAAVSACGGGGGERAEQVRSTGRAALAGTGYTSDQLEQALLTEAPGYRRAGEPDSGEYGSLKAIQNLEQLQRQVKLDKPRCANGGTGAPGGNIDRGTPTALVTFAKSDGQSVTETLMGITGDAADRQVNARVPAGCLAFRTKVGSQWSEHRVVELPRGDIGQGSRTVGVSTLSGNSTTKTWYVVFQGRQYVATISVFGPNVTRDDAEQLARQAYQQAGQILP